MADPATKVTLPQIEAIIADGVSFFLASGATAIATTHYPALKVWASRTPGVRNASVEFDERTLRPTYQLIQDIAGASSGLEIARRMQVPEPSSKMPCGGSTRVTPRHVTICAASRPPWMNNWYSKRP